MNEFSKRSTLKGSKDGSFEKRALLDKIRERKSEGTKSRRLAYECGIYDFSMKYSHTHGPSYEYSLPYADCNVDHPEWVGDKWCDSGTYNTESCGYDGGDCCEGSCTLDDPFGICGYNGYECVDPDYYDPWHSASYSYEYAECEVSHPEWIGDLWCDYGDYNTFPCGFDGGDCCVGSCIQNDPSGLMCGVNGYDCIDPEYNQYSYGYSHISSYDNPYPGCYVSHIEVSFLTLRVPLLMLFFSFCNIIFMTLCY
jgi:hypothetical protein